MYLLLLSLVHPTITAGASSSLSLVCSFKDGIKICKFVNAVYKSTISLAKAETSGKRFAACVQRRSMDLTFGIFDIIPILLVIDRQIL